MKKIILSLVLIITCILSLASCSDKSKDEYDPTAKIDTVVDMTDVKLVQSGKLTVGVSPDFAPMEFIDPTKKGQDQFVGADIYLAKSMAKAFGVELEIKAMDLDILLTSLNSHLIDLVISGFGYKEDRVASYLPSKVYYKEEGGGFTLLVKKGDASKYDSIDDLNKASIKIAAQTGTLQEEVLDSSFPDATRVKISNINEAITNLKQGSYNAIVCDLNVAKTKVASDGEIEMCDVGIPELENQGNYAWAQKENHAIINAANQVIDEVVNEGIFTEWYNYANSIYLNLGDEAAEITPLTYLKSKEDNYEEEILA